MSTNPSADWTMRSSFIDRTGDEQLAAGASIIDAMLHTHRAQIARSTHPLMGTANRNMQHRIFRLWQLSPEKKSVGFQWI